jgi:hypothetical protein
MSLSCNSSRDFGDLTESDSVTSLRRGGATYAFKCGVPGLSIKAQGDWHSDCWMRYCELSPSDQLGITQAMHRNIGAGQLQAQLCTDDEVALEAALAD